jgi:hypothetical protein
LNSLNIYSAARRNIAGRLRKTLGATPCDRGAALSVSEMSIPNMVTLLGSTKLLQDTHTEHLPLDCSCGMYGYKIPE